MWSSYLGNYVAQNLLLLSYIIHNHVLAFMFDGIIFVIEKGTFVYHSKDI